LPVISNHKVSSNVFLAKIKVYDSDIGHKLLGNCAYVMEV